MLLYATWDVRAFVTDPTRYLVQTTDRFKYELCKLIVVYLHDKRMTQAEFAEKHHIEPAGLSEIVH